MDRKPSPVVTKNSFSMGSCGEGLAQTGASYRAGRSDSPTRTRRKDATLGSPERRRRGRSGTEELLEHFATSPMMPTPAFSALDPCRADGAKLHDRRNCCKGLCTNGKCGGPPRCSNLYETCTTSKDCCDADAQCINGFCELPVAR